MSTSRKSKKSKVILPPLRNEIHLRKFGYNIHATQSTRRKALLSASKKYGMLKIYRRLNLITTKNKSHDAYYIMKKDVEFLKQQYKKESSRKKSK
jgi:hypothetical protein